MEQKKYQKQKNKSIEQKSHTIELIPVPDLTMVVLEHSTDDLLKIDLDWLNIKAIPLRSNEFRNYFKDVQSDWTKEHYGDVFDKMLLEFWVTQSLTAFVPIDTSLPIPDSTFQKVEQILLLMFPTDLQIIRWHYFSKSLTGKGFDLGSRRRDSKPLEYSVVGAETPFKFFLFESTTEVSTVNEFIKLTYNRLPTLEWMQVAFRSYISCFTQKDVEIRFLTLCIALESICGADTEISYQISRMCAVLNCETIEGGNNIYNNVKRIYAARSKVVHGENYQIKAEYYRYLLALTSRTLIELISLNIPTKEKLNELVKVFGFQDRSKFSYGYKQVVFLQSQMDKLKEALPKP